MTVAVGLKDILSILCILSVGEEEDRMTGWTGWLSSLGLGSILFPERLPPEQGRWIRNRMDGNIDRFLPVGSGWNGGNSDPRFLHSSHEY